MSRVRREVGAGGLLSGLTTGLTPTTVQRQDCGVRREETIGQRLRRLRLEREMSQRDLAGPGVSPAYVSRIEAGTRQPSIKALRVLARKLRVAVAYLETGRDLSDAEDRDMRLSEAELELRLADDPSQAETALGRLLEEAVEVGDASAELRARIGLGLAAAHRSDHRDAVEQLEGVVEMEDVSPVSHPDVYTALGHSYVELGRADLAVALFRRCLAELESLHPGTEAAYVRFATYLSYALSDQGDLAAAREVVNEALERIGDDADLYDQVRLYWSRARLSATAGEPRVALTNIRRAIALLQTTEDTLHLAHARLLYGEFLLAEGRLDEAEEQLRLCEPILGRAGDAQHRATLRAEQAKLAAKRGRGEVAVALAREALQILGDRTPSEQGRARWALAEGLAAGGEIDAASKEFAEAERLLSGEARYSVQLLQAWSSALRNAGRYEEAFPLLERAAELAAARATPPSRTF